MVEEIFSCIKELTRVVHVALPSLYISNEIAGVSDILESWKRQYITQLQGVVVSYKNVSLMTNSGFIVIDKPFIHYDVKATFELFCPSIGSIVKGKINRVSYDYVGCLVHNTINVAIKLSDNSADKLSKFLVLDRMILFAITCFDFHRKVIRVKGEITDECIKLMNETPSFSTQNNVFRNNQSTYYSSDLSDDDMSCDVKKKLEENNDATFEDSSSQSQSLTALNIPVQKSDLGIFNVDHLTASTGVFSTSHDSDSSQSQSDSQNKSKIDHDETVKEETDSEAMDVDIVSDSKSPPKQKKKHKDKKSKRKSSKSHSDNHVSKSSNKKKKDKTESLINNKLSKSSISNIETSSAIKSHKKKKSTKKIKNPLTNPLISIPCLSPLKKNQSDSLIKEELTTDSGYPSPSTKKTKSKSPKKSVIPGFKQDVTDISSMMDVLSTFQPSLEDQLLLNQDLKTEPVQKSKKDKKRKRVSTHKDGLSAKKKKTDGEQDNSLKKTKVKSNEKGQSKKKHKDKTDKTSKKDKKKKSNDKKLSKKDKLSYKIRPKKNKKSKDKKSKTKKSSKDNESA